MGITMPPGATIRARLRSASGRPEAKLRLAKRLAARGAGAKAVRHIAAAARDGLAEAQARLGLCYLHGNGVPPSMAEARYWLDNAAAAGDVTAQIELAKLALNGVSGAYQRGLFRNPATYTPAEPAYQLAADLARRAADAGSAEARALLATILHMQPSTAKPGDDADALYRESARFGWPLGQLGHAMTLLRAGTQDATHEARDLLSSAAASGLPTAHFLLGAMAEAGSGMDPDPDLAVTHYREAAERGHRDAKTRLGLALLAGRGTKRNLIEAETWLRHAAHGGDALAAAVLGDFHASRDLQPANPEEAARWYRFAAELGHPASARVLARMIAVGGEGQPDMVEIAKWLRTAIEGGEMAAWPELGGMIESLPPGHLPVLHEWLQRMIRENRPEAGYYVGVCVNCGIGTPADEELARRYYLWAAGEGVIEAMVGAGEMLLNGRGGPADPDLARSLFEYAGKRDHAGALYALGVMARDDPDARTSHFRRAAELGHTKAKLFVTPNPGTG
ncbi:MAG TPA: SEL1-like repeat protein [Acetobacteraceae bacterium]